MPSQKSIVIVDANVILRYFLRDIEEHYLKAEKFFNEIFSGKKTALIIFPVILEIVYVLTKLYGIKRKEVAEVLKDFISQKGIKVKEKEVVLKSLDIFEKSGIDYVDAIICAYSKNIEVMSFDRDIQKCIKKYSNL